MAALEFAVAIGNKIEESNCYGSLGNIYVKAADFTQAIECLQKATELNAKGWSQSKIAEYLGVASKGTIFNWIHDYPYGKK